MSIYKKEKKKSRNTGRNFRGLCPGTSTAVKARYFSFYVKKSMVGGTNFYFSISSQLVDTKDT